MKRISVLVAGIIAAIPLTAVFTSAHAQTPSTWGSVYGIMYTNLSNLVDPGSNSRWNFGSAAFGGGAMLHRQLGNSLRIGVDASLVRPSYERFDLEDSDSLRGSGTASVAALMATGRYGAGGGGDLGFYVTGGVGTIAYNLADLDGWNADVALQAGTGIEYRFSRNKAIALEWGRTWGYHEEEEGLGDGRQTHSALKIALRFGF